MILAFRGDFRWRLKAELWQSQYPVLLILNEEAGGGGGGVEGMKRKFTVEGPCVRGQNIHNAGVHC